LHEFDCALSIQISGTPGDKAWIATHLSCIRYTEDLQLRIMA